MQISNDIMKIGITNETRAPLATDDVTQGHLCGYFWIDKSDATPANWVVYIMVSCAEGAAVWKQITA